MSENFPLPLNEIPKNFHFSLNSNKLFIGKFTLDSPGWQAKYNYNCLSLEPQSHILP